MRPLRPLTISLALLVTCVAAPAFAGDDKPAKSKKDDDKGEKSDKADKPKKKGDGEIRRDPKGQTGVSPFTEKLVKGHKLMVARAFSEAVTAYQDAITEDDKNPVGHYFLGAAQLLKGDQKEAEAAWQNALRNMGADDNTRGKVQFAMADLRERQSRLEDAKSLWAEYGRFVADHAKAKGYPNSAAERQKMIDTRLDLEKKYGEVKARIAAREKEIKEKQEKDAQKDADAEEKKGGKKK